MLKSQAGFNWFQNSPLHCPKNTDSSGVHQFGTNSYCLEKRPTFGSSLNGDREAIDLKFLFSFSNPVLVSHFRSECTLGDFGKAIFRSMHLLFNFLLFFCDIVKCQGLFW